MAIQPNLNLDKLIRTTRGYEFFDGLVEVQTSVVLASLGVLTAFVVSPAFVRLVLGLSQTLGAWARWLPIVVLLLPVLVAFGARHALRAVRRRWLWRTSGFVEPLRSAVPPLALAFGVAIFVVASVAGVLVYRSGGREPMMILRVLVAGAGWAQGATMIGVSQRTGLRNHKWLGLVGGLASTVFLFWRLSFGHTWLAFTVLWALAFAVSGLVSLRRALRRTRELG